MAIPKSPYRAPGQSPPPAGRPPPDNDGLDEAALLRRRKRDAALDEKGRLERSAMVDRQLRLRIGFSLVLASAALLFALPDLLDDGFRARGTGRLVIMAGALFGYGGHVMLYGVGGAETLDTLPQRIWVGQLVSAVLGAAIGLAVYLLA